MKTLVQRCSKPHPPCSTVKSRPNVRSQAGRRWPCRTVLIFGERTNYSWISGVERLCHPLWRATTVSPRRQQRSRRQTWRYSKHGSIRYRRRSVWLSSSHCFIFSCLPPLRFRLASTSLVDSCAALTRNADAASAHAPAPATTRGGIPPHVVAAFLHPHRRRAFSPSPPTAGPS